MNFALKQLLYFFLSQINYLKRTGVSVSLPIERAVKYIEEELKYD